MAASNIVFITSPLEAEHVDRMRNVAPAAIEIIHEADLHPPVRYQADHKGREGFRLTAEQERRWRAHLAHATILWDFPGGSPAEGGGLALAPKVNGCRPPAPGSVRWCSAWAWRSPTCW